VKNEGNDVLHTLVGCPSSIFYILGKTLDTAKTLKLHDVDAEKCQDLLEPILAQLHAWDATQCSYPDDNIAWPLLAEAYRHTAILRILRLPDTYMIPCSDARIRACVIGILDASAQMSRESPYFKRFLFPLFVAGAETESPHQQQYVALCIDNIRDTTGFRYKSLYKLLQKTWAERKTSNGDINVPWFDFVRVKCVAKPALPYALTDRHRLARQISRGNMTTCSSKC
jgi:hypothetical protein